jgi:hypothetical protein
VVLIPIARTPSIVCVPRLSVVIVIPFGIVWDVGGVAGIATGAGCAGLILRVGTTVRCAI